MLLIVALAATAWLDLSAAREQTRELIGQQRERLLLAAEWQLDQVTQQNAALVEESAAAAASLRDQAEALTQSVRRFRLA